MSDVKPVRKHFVIQRGICSQPWFPKNPSFPRLQIQSYIADHLKLLWQNLLVYYLYFNIYLIFLFSLAMKHFLILLLEYLYLFFFLTTFSFLWSWSNCLSKQQSAPFHCPQVCVRHLDALSLKYESHLHKKKNKMARFEWVSFFTKVMQGTDKTSISHWNLDNLSSLVLDIPIYIYVCVCVSMYVCMYL